MARPAGFEPAALGLEVLAPSCPARSSGSQPVDSIRFDAPGRVQPSQPVAPFSKDFAAQVLHGQPGRAGRRLRTVRGGAEDLLTVREVAKRLGVCTATVYALCDRGELPHVRISNAVRIAPADLASFIEGKRQKGTVSNNGTI